MGILAQVRAVFSGHSKLQQQYQQIAASLTTATLLIDSQQSILYANTACLQALRELRPDIEKFLPDFNVDQLVGYPALRFFQGLGVRADAWQAAADSEVMLLLGGQQWRCAFRTIVAEDSAVSFKFVQLQPVPVQDDFQLLLQQVSGHLLLFSCDPAGKIRHLTPAFLQCIGAAADELTGKDFTSLWSQQPEQQSIAKKLQSEIKRPTGLG